MSDPSAEAAAADSPTRQATALLAVIWAWLVVHLLSPERLWIPGTELTVRMAVAHAGTALLLLAVTLLAVPCAALCADRIVAREARHGPTLIAGAALFVLAWLALQGAPEGSGRAGAFGISVDLALGIVAASLNGIAIATGRRLGALGLLAPMGVLMATAARHIMDSLSEATTDLKPVAIAVPIVFALSLVALAWPRRPPRPLPFLGSPSDRFLRLGSRPPGAARAFWTVALVALLGRPAFVETSIELHMRVMGEAARATLGSAWEYGGVAGAVVYLVASRLLPLRLLLPAALVLSAAAIFPLPHATEPRALMLAGMGFGATHVFVLTAILHLLTEASPRGREAWTFAAMTLVSTFGGNVLSTPFFVAIARDSLERLPLAVSVAAGLALVALWFVPRALLGDATVATWPRSPRTTEPPTAPATASDASS